MQTDPVLVTGPIRSGTTYVGRVLSESGYWAYLDEPCNVTNGIEGIHLWFPYVSEFPESETSRQHKYALDGLMNGRFTYKTPPNPDHGSFRKQLKKWLGGRSAWMGYRYKLLERFYKPVLIKDPTALPSSGYLSNTYGMKVIFLIRHPAAFYMSMKKQQWDFDFNNLLQQKELCENLLQDYTDEIKQNPKSYIDRIALLWKVLAGIERQILENQIKSRGFKITHEALCLEPMETMQQVFDFLEIPLNNKVRQFIIRTTSSEKTDAEEGKVHDFFRDSRRLAWGWKQKITEEERDRIREVTENEAAHHYPDSTWSLGEV